MKKILVFSLFFIMMVNPISTKAEVFGGKWTSSPSYYISTSNAYYVNLNISMNRWNVQLSAISANISIYYTSQLNASVSVITYAYGNTGWNAMGTPGPALTSGTYTYGSIKLNTTYMNNYTASKNSAICTHEWGHILGIAHTMSNNIDSLMYYGGSSVYYDQWGIYAPTYYDVTQLNLIY